MNLANELDKQLSWHWETHLRPRWDGLTDREYLWEPVPGMWSVRPRGQGVATEVGAGDVIIDFALPEPSPPPATTIAWRIGHLLVGVFGDRLARHFGGAAVDFDSYHYPATAADALARLDVMYTDWISGVRSLDDDALAAPCGEPGFEQDPMMALVLHIHREVIHHGAEISCFVTSTPGGPDFHGSAVAGRAPQRAVDRCLSRVSGGLDRREGLPRTRYFGLCMSAVPPVTGSMGTVGAMF